MAIFFIIGIFVGYYLSIVGNKISKITDDFYTINVLNDISYLKELLLEVTFLKYFLEINTSDFSIKSIKNHIINIFIIAMTFAIEYYYYKKFHFSFFELILILFALSILYVGIIIDINTMLIPDVFIIIPSVIFIFTDYPDKLENILYFFVIYFSSYLINYIQIKTDKLFIGIQDIKLYAISILLFGIAPMNEILFLSNILALTFFIYKYIKYKTQLNHFGIYIYITIVIFPLIKILGFDFLDI